jgi:hypothetical protein
VGNALCVLPHRDQPGETQPPSLVCGWHERAVGRKLGELENDWLDLDLIEEPGTAPRRDEAGKGRRLKKPYPPAPANLDVLVLRDPRTKIQRIPTLQRDGKPSDMSEPVINPVASMRDLAEMVRDGRPLTQTITRDRVIAGRTVPVSRTIPAALPAGIIGCIDLLRRHTNWICEQDFVDVFWDELNAVHRAVRAALNDQANRFIGRCYLEADGDPTQKCAGNLLRPNGSLSVKCHRCGAAWVTAAQLARLQLALGRTGT